LLEAARCADIRPVRVKSVEQQALQGMHRIRSLWMGTRTSRINALRGFCREFGIAIPVGARTGIEAISRVLADPNTTVPELIRGTAKLLVEEIHFLEARSNHNKAACALANKLARICYATLRDKEPFGEQTVRLSKKVNRESFVMPA
jgi:transposase